MTGGVDLQIHYPPDPRSNEEILKFALKDLEEKGRIEFTGEYGNEVATFIPFVAWLKREGWLSGRHVVSYAGMRPYYFFLSDDEFRPKNDRRRVCLLTDRWWPSNATHTAKKEEWHVIPDYRSHYSKSGTSLKKPILFIQNKFSTEWNYGPINFIPLSTINKICSIFEHLFHIVYSRPGITKLSKNYSEDNDDNCNYPDLSVLRQFKNVEIFEETCIRDRVNYNQTKLEYMARSYFFIAVQGGGAHIASAFGNSVMLLLHRAGSEYPHAYTEGPYKYLSEKPQLLLVAQNDRDFAKGLKIVKEVKVTDRGAEIPPDVYASALNLAL